MKTSIAVAAFAAIAVAGIGTAQADSAQEYLISSTNQGVGSVPSGQRTLQPYSTDKSCSYAVETAPGGVNLGNWYTITSATKVNLTEGYYLVTNCQPPSFLSTGSAGSS
ncbi:hypothetical protein ACFXHA_19115 [Nocardia sp. NPDC059240]|uniref:hypothetical protein n=1 Tax=Nocardia sp. NPDC059240 TaxID=3346786 RepID=UPI00369008D3